MHIGNLYFGRRVYGTKEFKWFYSPMLKETMRKSGFIFFWWFGHKWYICLMRKNSR